MTPSNTKFYDEQGCIARYQELLTQHQAHVEVQATILAHESANADIQAIGYALLSAMPRIREPLVLTNFVRVALEVAWRLGYQAAKAEATRSVLLGWQVGEQQQP